MPQIHREQLNNGLWLLAEPIQAAQSVAMSILVPAGTAAEPADRQGLAATAAEMIFRGAADLDARAHSDALDRLGVQRTGSARTHYLHLAAVMLGDKLSAAFPLLAAMITRPRLEESALGPSKDLVLQSLSSLQDEPQDRTFVELARRHLPEPLGRCHLGRPDDVAQITRADVQRFCRARFVPSGSVLAFAGKLPWPQLRDVVQREFAAWRGRCQEPPVTAAAPRGYGHYPADSTQTHIGLAFDAVAEPDERSVLQQVANAVLSGGMSGRLFTELRERRGLCYSVFSRYSSDRQRGVMTAYVGTMAARASESLRVLLGELRRLSQGVVDGEFQRAVVGMRSGLVMQGESTSARAAALAADQLVLGRPRSLEELQQRVSQVALTQLNEFLRAQPSAGFTVVSIGPSALDVPSL